MLVIQYIEIKRLVYNAVFIVISDEVNLSKFTSESTKFQNPDPHFGKLDSMFDI